MSEKNSIEKENESKVYICENCRKEHEGSYGSGRFCSKSCCSSYCLSLGRHNPRPNRKFKGKGGWKCPYCNEVFESRRKLQDHQKETNHKTERNKIYSIPSENPICPFCGEEHKLKHAMTLHQRLCKKNPNQDLNLLNKLSKIHKESNNKTETKSKLSELAINNNFWKYRAENPILYESKFNGTIKLDSEWELIVAKRLDELNVNWYRPKIRIPYIDNQGYEKGYFPDFYVENYKCFVEVKAPYIAKRQNKNGKIDYLKSHYDFIFWIEDEELCNTFELHNMNYPYEVEKEVDDLIDKYKRKAEEKKKKKIKNEIRKSNMNKELEKERWKIIQQSNIDFQKFGWVIEISKLFGVATNRGGKYIREHFPEFYKTCYVRKPYENKNQQLDLFDL